VIISAVKAAEAIAGRGLHDTAAVPHDGRGASAARGAPRHPTDAR
jgi:hypothetical protein